jgi:hypothetical protein
MNLTSTSSFVNFDLASEGAMSMSTPSQREACLKLSRIVAGKIDPDGLQLGVLVVGVNRLVAAPEARLLEAAERCRHVALAE